MAALARPGGEAPPQPATWFVGAGPAGPRARSGDRTVAATTPSELWRLIAAASDAAFVHLAAEGLRPDPDGLRSAVAGLVASGAGGAIGRVRFADGLSRATLRAGTARFLDVAAGALVVRTAALADAAAGIARPELDGFWTWDLVRALERRWQIEAMAEVLASAPGPAPDPAARLPLFRAGTGPHPDGARPILVYGEITASVSLYFDGLPPDLLARLRFLRPGDLASDLAWLAGASLVLIVRGFAPLLAGGVMDLLDEIGVPWLWFVDDDFLALSREVPSLAPYGEAAIVRFVGRAAGVVASSAAILESLGAACGTGLRRAILWPCVYDGDLAAGRREAQAGPVRIGAFGGDFRRRFLQAEIMPALADLRRSGAVTLFLTEALAPPRKTAGLHVMPFEPDFRAFALGWRALGLAALLHPYGETANIAAKSPASVLAAAYLGAVPVVGHEPAYAGLDEGVGVLKAGREGADWRRAVDRLRVAGGAEALFTRLDAWARSTFAPERARAPFAELEALAIAGGAVARDQRWQAACRSRALRARFQPAPGPPAPTPRRRGLARLRASVIKRWKRVLGKTPGR